MNKTIKIGKHIKDCSSVRCVKDGTWDSAWCVPEQRYTAISEGKRGRPPEKSYLIFRCNTIDCEAKLAVESKLILKDLPKF